MAPGLSSNTSDAKLLPSSSLFPITELKLMSNCTSSSSLTVVAGLTVFNGKGSLSLSNNPIFCGSCPRSRREDLAASTVFATALAKTVARSTLSNARILDQGRGTRRFERVTLKWNWIPFRKNWVMKVLYAAYVIKKKKVILFDGFHWVYIPIYKVTRMYYYVLV